MKHAQKPDHVSLATLINRLREGRYVIPDFQREFEWESKDIRELMRSIFLDYHIGSLLLWKGKPGNFDALACEAIYGAKVTGEETHIVLDGQQRLTAMHYAFLTPEVPAPGRKNRFLFFVRVNEFMNEAYDKAFEYTWTRWGENLLASQAAQFESHMFPLAVVGRKRSATWKWVQGYERHWRSKEAKARESGDDATEALAKQHREHAVAFGDHLEGIRHDYQVVYIELDQDIAIDKVCDIFTQINSRGVRLDAFDLINALLKPKDIQLKHLWRQARGRLDFVETGRMNVYILQVMSILRQAYCSPKYLYYLLPGQRKPVRHPDGSRHAEVLVPDGDTFKRLWDEAVDALERTISLLRHPREFAAIASRYLPYVSILPALSAAHRAATDLPAARRLDALRKVRHWYWASVFTNRYSGAVESTSARDFQDLRQWFDSDLAEPGLIGEFRERFRSIDLRRETRRGTSVYNGIFNLIVLRGARDWITGMSPMHDDLDDHHIVPKSWGKNASPATSIDSILNRTPLSADTNRNVIKNRLPNEYIPELIEANSEVGVRATLESHLISPDAFDILLRVPFKRDDYEEFIAERLRTTLAAIEDLLIKERLDLTPQLRELDGHVETIELEVRDRIAGALDGDPALLPSHVREKIQHRIRAASKKNPAMDAERYATLPGKLEYTDLRELEDIVKNKALRSRFDGLFPNREALVKHFDQLADLRNGIRHSRAVDELTQKQGEASILWFRKVLQV